MSRRFKIILAIRFLGYLVFFAGLVSFIFMLGPLVKVEARYRVDQISKVKRVVPEMVGPEERPAGQEPQENASFGEVNPGEESIVPV